MPGDLYSRFARSFGLFADRPLIEADRKVWRYRDIATAAARLSAHLAELGVAPGERLLVQTNKSVETVILYIACIRAGAIYLPLNTDYTEAELAYFVADAEPALAVCRPQSADLFGRIGGEHLTIRTIEALFSEQAWTRPRQ